MSGDQIYDPDPILTKFLGLLSFALVFGLGILVGYFLR